MRSHGLSRPAWHCLMTGSSSLSPLSSLSSLSLSSRQRRRLLVHERLSTGRHVIRSLELSRSACHCLMTGLSSLSPLSLSSCYVTPCVQIRALYSYKRTTVEGETHHMIEDITFKGTLSACTHGLLNILCTMGWLPCRPSFCCLARYSPCLHSPLCCLACYSPCLHPPLCWLACHPSFCCLALWTFSLPQALTFPSCSQASLDRLAFQVRSG